VPEALVGLDSFACKVKDGWMIFDVNFENYFFKERHIPMDAYKSVIKDLILEHTSIKA
jgi:hypothetical protein